MVILIEDNKIRNVKLTRKLKKAKNEDKKKKPKKRLRARW